MPSELEERSFGLFGVLFALKQSLDIHRIIAVNASKINQAGAGKSFFAFTQGLAIQSCVNNICKLVEAERGSYQLNSIPGIICYLQDKNPDCHDPQIVQNFIQKYNVEYKRGEEVQCLKSAFDSFYARNAEELKRLKHFRDKRIAHLENVPVERKTSLSSYAVMDGFLTFGYGFYSTVQDAFTGSGSIRLESEQKVTVGLKYLLELKGIQDIKTDFDD